MTQQYLSGELSALLAELQAAVSGATCAEEVLRLRELAETVPSVALASVVTRALEVTDAACWESLTCEDTTSFVRQAVIGAQLLEFGICSRLVADA